MSIEHKVIGNSKNFTLAIGKYAFTPCEYIPKNYLEWLLESMASEQDKEIISEYLSDNKSK